MLILPDGPLVAMENFAPLFPLDGSRFELMSAPVADAVGHYSPGCTSRYFKKENDELCLPQGVPFSWDVTEGAPLFLFLGRTPDLRGADVYRLSGREVKIHNLFPGSTYYWKLKGGKRADGSLPESSLRFFCTEKGVRTLRIGGVSNARDVGGYPAEGGKRVRMGMAYRSAKFDQITEEGRDCVKRELRLRTDLDLRTPDTEATSPLKGIVPNYRNIAGPFYSGATGIGSGSPDENNRRFVEELRVFTKRENYPIAFHCSVGRDRTGTLACVLGGLLGVSWENLSLDYELSFLSRAGTLDGSDPVRLVPDYLQSIPRSLSFYGGGSFRERCENYVRAWGMEEREIAAIRAILLEEGGESC